MSVKKLIFILCDDYVLAEGLRVVQWARANGHPVKLLRVNKVGCATKTSTASVSWRLFRKVDAMLWCSPFSALKRRPVNEIATEFDVEVLDVEGVYRGVRLFINEPDFVKRGTIIRAIPDIIDGPILNKSILSIHGGAYTGFRGGPAGFWEIVCGRRVTEGCVQLLNTRLDGGQILGITKQLTHPSYSVNFSLVYQNSISLLLRVIDDDGLGLIRRPSGFESMFDNAPINKARRAPMLLSMAKAFILSLAYRIECGLNRLGLILGQYGGKINWHDRNWCVEGYNKDKKFSFSLFANHEYFYADPFVVEAPSGTHLFLERYDFSKGVGSIAIFHLDSGKPVFLGVIEGDNGSHLSFPSTVWSDGLFHVLCERGDGALELLRISSKDFTVHDRQIIRFKNVVLSDSCIIEVSHDQIFIRATVFESTGWRNVGAIFDLRISLSSMTIESAVYVCDGRLGGSVDQDPVVLQRSSTRQYGVGISFLDQLSHKGRLVEIDGVDFRCRKRLHHFCYNAGWTVYDYSC